MKKRLRILQVSPSYWPATKWGGPIVSTRAICDGVSAFDNIEVEVLTTDAAGPSLGDRLELADNPARFSAGYQVTYTRRVLGRDISPELLFRLFPAVSRADVVHVTGTYSFPTLPAFAVARVLDKPLVWSPRGALQARHEWQGAQSRSKKWFEQACAAIAPANTVLHVTSEREREMSKISFPRMRAAVIANPIPLPEDPVDRDYRRNGVLNLAFLSRVHPKKGVETLLDAFAAAGKPLSRAVLDIYGEGEAEYLDSLKRRAAGLGIEDRVFFHGHVDGHKKNAAYRKADLFVLPSYSENFGIVVGEALSFRVPAITSTRTPWSDLVTEGCGLQVPPGDVDRLVNALLAMSSSDLASMGEAGRNYMQRSFSTERMAQKMRDLYDAMVGSTNSHYIFSE